MKVREIEKKYGITIIYVGMDEEASEICVCGHHASEHFGIGTAGGCRGCGDDKVEARPWVHNFIPESHKEVAARIQAEVGRGFEKREKEKEKRLLAFMKRDRLI